jgi:hypothetical protein
MNLTDKVSIKLELGSLATLIAGLYVAHTNIQIEAVPSSLFIEIAEQLSEYLPSWRYDELSLEDWIKYELVIMPIDYFNEVELNELRNATIYLERRLGNATLVASAMIPWED